MIQEDMSGTLGCGNDQTIFCLQGAMVGRADTAGPGGKGWRSDGAAYTVDTKAPSVICVATQQGGAEIAIDLCPTITQATGTSGNNQPVVCLLNDHGGGVLKAEKGDVSPTLRAEAHQHEPVVLLAPGLSISKAQRPGALDLKKKSPLRYGPDL